MKPINRKGAFVLEPRGMRGRNPEEVAAYAPIRHDCLPADTSPQDPQPQDGGPGLRTAIEVTHEALLIDFDNCSRAKQASFYIFGPIKSQGQPGSAEESCRLDLGHWVSSSFGATKYGNLTVLLAQVELVGFHIKHNIDIIRQLSGLRFRCPTGSPTTPARCCSS